MRRHLGIGLGVALCAAAVAVQAQQPQGGGGARVRVNPIISTLEAGNIVDGSVLTFIDMEHNPYDIVEARKLIEAAGTKKKPNGQIEKAPFIRLPMYGHEPSGWAALQVLDLGALGVIFQSIETKAEAELAVGAMRFAPQTGSGIATYPKGYRSGAPRGGKTLVMSADELLRHSDVWPLNPDGELLCVLMIETEDGVKRAKEIMSVPGVGAILVGSYDLSLSLGQGPPKQGAQPYTAETEAAIATIAKTCQATKVVCGIAAGGGKEYRDKLVKMGYRLFLN